MDYDASGLRGHIRINVLDWIFKHERRLLVQGIESDDAPRLRLAQSQVKRLAVQNQRLNEKLKRLRDKPREMTLKFQAAERAVDTAQRYFDGLLSDSPLVDEFNKHVQVFRRAGVLK